MRRQTTNHQEFNEEMLKLFIERKRSEGRSERTLKHYELVIQICFKYINKSVKDITEDDMFMFFVKFKAEREVSNVYLDNIRLVFNSFFSWLHNKGIIRKNPMCGINPIKSDFKIKKPFSNIELEKLKNATKDKRERALIEFLYSTGVRVSELCALNREDIDYRNLEVIVYGKGGKERVTFISQTALYYLTEYLQSRTDHCPALFVTKKAPFTRLSVNGVECTLRELGTKAGVEKVHPHRFRRTVATKLLNSGTPLEDVKTLLGHTKLDTTMIYCNIDKENIKHFHRIYL